MFAYCNNNPINFEDSSGCSLIPSTVVMNDSTGGDIHIGTTNSVDLQRINDHNKSATVANLKKYMNNTDENVVLKSDFFSFYKGVPVIRTNGKRSGSFGVIFLTRSTNNLDYPEDTLRHEYGHVLQLEEMGLFTYSLCIFLPSWQMWGSDNYYEKPWEITADILGGVQSRMHTQEKITAGFNYTELSKYIGPWAWFTIR